MTPCLLIFLASAATLLALPVALACDNRPPATSTPDVAGSASTLAAAQQPSERDAVLAPATSQSSLSRLDEVRACGRLVCSSDDAIPVTVAQDVIRAAGNYGEIY